MRTAGGPGAGARCDRLVEVVTDYLEGALDEPTAAAFDAHLARCPGCDAYVDQMRQTAHQLGHVSLDGLSDAARARLLEAFGDMYRNVPLPP
jgi:anti-sigma factor RsiW